MTETAAEDAGRLAGLRVLLDVARARSALKSLSMPLSFSASVLSEASGPVEKRTGCFGADRVELGPGRIALLLEPGDEDLADADPLALGQRLGPRLDVVQHVRDRLHLGDGMIELVHAAPVGCVCESIRPGRTILPPRSMTFVASPLVARTSSFVPTCTMRLAADGDRLGDRKRLIDRHDLAVVQDQVGRLSRDACCRQRARKTATRSKR